ncbi:DUF4259 domain-containing protein [Streptomyces pilosus]|uniref:DUF4259 domain-containing protein n=1 Tax=Streptomyces pilosus TaxID=28893 RepID=UPI00364217A4
MPAEFQWGTGPFDSDPAADFVDDPEGLTYQQVIDVSRRASQQVTDSGEHVDGKDGAEAVAAGALVASTRPDTPIMTDSMTALTNPCTNCRPPVARRRPSHWTVFSAGQLARFRCSAYAGAGRV